MKIIITTGISGGHLFPALAVAEELMRAGRDCHILFVTGRKSVAVRILKREKFPFMLLEPFPRPGGLRYIIIVVRFFQNLISSLLILGREKPDVVLGFGGLISAPVILCARIFGIPVVIHEQNVIPGRTNLMLGALADKIAISFDETRKFIKNSSKTVFTGNPIRTALKGAGKTESLKEFGFEEGGFILFVMGGSQGAHSINQAAVKVFEKLTPATRSRFQVIHITGEKDRSAIQDRYRDLGVASKVYSFMDDIKAAYSASDLVVSRAGASVLIEINFLRKASILIPYPYARSHQMANAAYMVDRDMAVMIEDDDRLSQRLYESIMDFYNDRTREIRFLKTEKLESNGAKNMVNLLLKEFVTKP